jgi:integrase
VKLTKKPNGWEARFRCGDGPRVRVTIHAPDEATATTRAARLRARVDAMVEAGLDAKAAELLREAATERTERGFAGFERAMRDIALEAQSAPAPSGPRTFHDVLDLWLSGELRRRHPQSCKAKGEASVLQTWGMYSKHIRPILGQMPIAEITEEDAQRVVAAVAHLEQPTRRRYETLVRLVLGFGVHPLKLIQVNPAGHKGFVEPEGAMPMFGYLYPDEEATVNGCPLVAFGDRFAYAFEARNGCRLAELEGATWSDVDLKRGTFSLDENKTDTPRWWSLEADVIEALDIVRSSRPDEVEDNDPIFPGLDIKHISKRFRKQLITAGVTRATLHTPKGNRRPIRAYDWRATFCTVALASGRDERWVRKRTGHTTSEMLARYVREAESLSELALPWFAPMADVLGLRGDQRPLLGGGSTMPLLPSGEMCSETVLTVGHEVGLMPPFQPKKALNGSPARTSTGSFRAPQDVKTPEICAPGIPSGADGPPPNGSMGQITDPVARGILIEAIGVATAAGQWSTVARLAAILDGQPAASAAG